ncbi:MAG: amidohydrolase [Hyphomonadaceae bacterium]|nr:MAG: amidohydrolase [Hyphomonadaceae bacterium]
MKVNRRNALSFVAASPFLGGATSANLTIFEAAKIVTMEPSAPICRFVAVADGIIVSTANSIAGLEPWTRSRTVTIDRRFANKVLMPGLIDPHIHPMQSAVMLNIPFIAPDDWSLPSGNYLGVRAEAAYRARFRQMLAASSARPFITWGYHELFHGTINKQILDEIAPDRPVIVWQRSFHDIFVNSAMLHEWGLDTKSAFDEFFGQSHADPHHVSFENGSFSETGSMAIVNKMRPYILTPDKISSGMLDLQKMMTKSGVTTTSDMGTGVFASFDTEATLIKAAFGRANSPARVMLMPMASYVPLDTNLDSWFDALKAKWSSPNIRVDRRIKMLADGAFFAQNMRMNAPGYTDGHTGKWITEPEAITAQFARFWNAGFNLHVHVNGDEGLDVVLDGIAALPVKPAQTITLEHLGFSTEAQNRRIARLGLMVSAQPNYIRVLGDAYSRNGLGPDRGASINRLGSLERKGVVLGLHSDFNMAPIDPLYLAWIAANRITIGGNVLASNERISLDKALRAITIEAAQVIGMDAQIGSIAAGKKADFAVLDKDPYQIGAARLREIKIHGVIFEGQFTAAT